MSKAPQPPDLSPAQLELLRIPRVWDDFSKETAYQRRQKKELAVRYGVAAVLHLPREVRSRIKEMATYTALTTPASHLAHVALLKGEGPVAGQFFPELRRQRPDSNPYVDYMIVSRFFMGQSGSKLINVKQDLGDKTYKYMKRATIHDEVGDEGITVDGTMDFVEDRWLEFHPGETLEFGVTLLSDKGLATFNRIRPKNLLIGFRDPVVWLSGMGMDGEDEEQELYELNRWDDFISVSPVQHEKYRESLPEVLDVLGDRAVMKFEDFAWTDK